MQADELLFRIQRHLAEEALAAECRWHQRGRFGTLVNPKLVDPQLNHVRPLGEQPLDPLIDRASFVEACALLAECDRPLVVLFDPSQAPVMLPAFLTDEHFVLEARELLMVLAAEDAGLPTAPDIKIVPVGLGPYLRPYARLLSQIFAGNEALLSPVATEAILRAEIASGNTRHVCALRTGRAVGTGALRGRGRVMEVAGIGTLAQVRCGGIATAVVRHLVSLAQMRQAELIFLAVASQSPAERLYHRLGFRVVGEQQRWRRP